MYLVFPVSRLPTDRKVKKEGFLKMSVPGFASVMSSYFSQSEHYVSQSEQGGGFNICLYMAFPLMFLHLSQRGVFNMSVSGFPPCHVFLLIKR